MIKLVKGNIDKLEGRVLSYSRFTKDLKEIMDDDERKELEEAMENAGVKELPKSPIGCTFFASSNPKDLLKKVTEYTELDEDAQEKINKAKNEFGDGGLVPFFAAQLPILDEEEIMASEEDVIYAGSFNDPLFCLNSAMMGIAFYRMKFSDQLMNSIVKSKQEVKIKEKIPVRQNIIYTQIPQKELPEFIYKNYIIQMMNAKRDNKREEYKTLEDQFISFGKGSHFQSDIVDLCKFISSSSGDIKDTPIITATINKINAINTENFEAAAKYRDEVNLLRQEWQKGK